MARVANRVREPTMSGGSATDDITIGPLTIEFSNSERRCGACTLCCKLLPVHDIQKPANQVCKFQRSAKGCTVYRQRGFPTSCALWNCLWLGDDDAADLPRPDHAHYVIDVSPDYIEIIMSSGEVMRVDVVQIWVDPKHPHAYQDPRLLAWIERRAQRLGHAALIRFDSYRALTLFPPSLSSDGNWHERAGQSTAHHTPADILGDRA